MNGGGYGDDGDGVGADAVVQNYFVADDSVKGGVCGGGS